MTETLIIWKEETSKAFEQMQGQAYISEFAKPFVYDEFSVLEIYDCKPKTCSCGMILEEAEEDEEEADEWEDERRHKDWIDRSTNDFD